MNYNIYNKKLNIIIGFGLRKSASAPPRGEAREPGMQLSAFHQDRADRLPEQTQRRVYGGAARAPRRCGGGSGIVKIFHWEGEPQRELDTATTTATTTSLCILQLIIRSTAFTTSGAPPPSSRTAYSYSTRHLHGTAIERTVYARELCDEPLIPHSTRTAWTYRAVFRSPL